MRVARGVVGLCVLVLWAPTPAAAQVTQGNLLVNGNAETGRSVPDEVEPNSLGVAPPVGWQTSQSVSQVKYGQGGFPDNEGQGGTAFFAGGPGMGQRFMSQDLFLDAQTVNAIAAGGVYATIQGDFGGYASDPDRAQLRVVFGIDEEHSLTEVTVGPVSYLDRMSQTRLLHRIATIALPAGVKYMRADVEYTPANGQYVDGYADNLSVTLAGPGSPEPTPTPTPTATATVTVSAAPGTTPTVSPTPAADGKPVNRARPQIVQADGSQFINSKPGPVPHTYQCLPGTWDDRDPGTAFRYEWQRLRRDNAYADGYRPTTVAYGDVFHARAETQLALDPSRWLFRCAVEATNANGTRTVVSAPKQLDPELKPFGGYFEYGNFRIRGIDVFQVTQPTAGALVSKFDFTLKPADISTAFGLDMAGGGTPTAYKRRADGGAELPKGADPQRVPYAGVHLDTGKPAVAVVYVSRESLPPDGANAHPVRVTLQPTRDGRPFDSPLTQQITAVPITTQLYVTKSQRGDTYYGLQFRVPPAWLQAAESSRVGLEARVAFVPTFGLKEPVQCDGRNCAGDDRFTLEALDARTPPAMRWMGLLLRYRPTDQAPNLDTVLARAKQLLPGGERVTTMTIGDEVPIDDIVDGADYQVGKDKCKDDAKATDPLRACQERHIGARVKEWEARNSFLRSRYDILVGVHQFTNPGWSIGPTITEQNPKRRPIALLNSGSIGRPLDGEMHEIGHLYDLPHAGLSCPVPEGFDLNQTASGPQKGEDWPADGRGRLQGVQFQPPTAAMTNLEGNNRIDPHVDEGPEPPPPATKAGAPNADDRLARLDFMSYCAREGIDASGTYFNNSWISPRSWNHMMLALERYGARRPPVRSLRAGEEQAIALGVVGADGGSITRVVPPDGDLVAPPSVEGASVHLRSYDAGGAVLSDAGVEVDASSESASDGGSFSGPVAPAAARVELLRGADVLATLTRSQPPAVEVLAPGGATRVRGGALEVRWNASDPDGDALEAAVDYSADGGKTWRTMYVGPSAPGSVRLDGRKLEGSRNARIRVGVNDGFNEPRAQSAEFRVDGTAPVVEISRPAAGEPLRSTGRTLLIGSATDDGLRAIAGKRLTWFAGKRRLGSGAQLSVQLPAGRYPLRLVARDAAGRAGTARRAVKVARPELRLDTLSYARVVGKAARSVRVTIATSLPATLVARGKTSRVGTKARRVRIQLPRRPLHGRLRVKVRVRAGAGRIAGALTVTRR